MKTLAILLYPDVLMLDVAGPIEVFSIANRYLDAADAYRISTISADASPVRASNGIAMLADSTVSDAEGAYDLLLVPGGPGAYNDSQADLLPWLREAAQRSEQYASICTGAFIMGNAGLLDGCRVTTHWNYSDRLAKRFAQAKVETDQVYIKDGKLLSSGGVTAGIDLALAVVAADHGRKVALDVAKVLLVAMKRQGGQAQFSPLLGEIGQEDSPISRVQNYVLEHIDEAFNVARMAGLATMSARNFARLFTRETDMTPMAFVQCARIDKARSLLETTDLPLKTIAFHSGFGCVRHMRLAFRERLDLTPAEYRSRFG
jgi:transcriptional regulator GlxA family with amidase domain